MNLAARRPLRIVTPLALAALAAAHLGWQDEKPVDKAGFARTTVDFGIVVSDIEKSVAFYKNGLGFTEVEGFDVPADFGGDTGLSDRQAFHVHVFVLGEGETATKIKLMQFPEAPGKTVDNGFIHSSYGISYLTVFVNDIATAVERAKKHGAKPLAKGPVSLPKGFPEGIELAVFRDPDGNLIELVGPRPK